MVLPYRELCLRFTTIEKGEGVQANDYTNESVHSLFDAHLTRVTNNFDQKQYNLTHQTEQLHFNISLQFVG